MFKFEAITPFEMLNPVKNHKFGLGLFPVNVLLSTPSGLVIIFIKVRCEIIGQKKNNFPQI